MSIIDTDREWEDFGKNDPYFGVISRDKYHKSNLTDESKEDFSRLDLIILITL